MVGYRNRTLSQNELKQDTIPSIIQDTKKRIYKIKYFLLKYLLQTLIWLSKWCFYGIAVSPYSIWTKIDIKKLSIFI